MANHARTLKAYEQELNETISHIVIGEHYSCIYSSDDDEDARPPRDKTNVKLSREEGLAILDEEYDNSFGGADCYPFYAWSENYLFTVSEYDGATGVSAWPRHPVNCIPDFD